MKKLTQKHSLKLVTLGAFLTLTLPLTTMVSHAGLYRWVDASGKVHFSDKVPPAIAQKGHSELSQNGVEKKKVLSAEEIQQIKAEEEASAEEKKLKALSIEREKQALQGQRKHDAYLLSTFDSRDELINYYEDKISTLSGTANILIARNDSLNTKVKGLLQKQSKVKNETIKNSLVIEIEGLKKSILQYEKALEDNEKEVILLKSQYENDLKRYVELASR